MLCQPTDFITIIHWCCVCLSSDVCVFSKLTVKYSVFMQEKRFKYRLVTTLLMMMMMMKTYGMLNSNSSSASLSTY